MGRAIVVLIQWISRVFPLLSRMVAALKASRWAQWIIFYFLFWMGGIIKKIFVTMGISFVTYKVVLGPLVSIISGYFFSLPSVWIGFAGLLRLDQAVTVIFSATVVSAVDRMSVRRVRDWTP